MIVNLIFLSTGLYSQEQVFKPFKLDVGFTLDKPSNYFDNYLLGGTGGALYIEPRYSINDKLTFGLRTEYISGLWTLDIHSATSWFTGNSTSLITILITGDYYFSTANIRPFIGLGLGIYEYSLNETIYSDNFNPLPVLIGTINRTITDYGFAPRIGLNIKHLQLAATYNYAGKALHNFAGLQVGYEFGGGRRP